MFLTHRFTHTCQIEVLQWRLSSHCNVQLRVEPADAVICAIDLAFGGSDVVCVCDGSTSINVFNLHKEKKQIYGCTELFN